jgi:hypothetical protein
MAKRHHYLPQFYLQQFLSKKGGFVVYDKKTGQRRPQTPINTGVEGHLYTQLDAEGKPTDFIEEEMLSPHDGHVAPILEKWLEPDASPTDGDVEVMASFLAFMNTRVPRNIEMVREFGRLFAVHRSRKMAEDQERLESFLKHYHDGHPADPMTLEEVQALLRDPEKSVKISVERRAAVILSLRATADMFLIFWKCIGCCCPCLTGDGLLRATRQLPFLCRRLAAKRCLGRARLFLIFRLRSRCRLRNAFSLAANL